jgi:hypothetical protein
MWPFVVAVVAILAWAATRIIQSGTQAGSGAARGQLEDVVKRLEAAEAERARLRQRVENLEAIVTSEHYELEREARRALPAPPGRELAEGGSRPPLALEEHDAPEDDEARAARLARRVRGG